jgi:hypothetical protein
MNGMQMERHGSAVPLSTSDKCGEWPTCYGYLRGRNPNIEEIGAVRGQMVEFCESNQLYLARIFHDLDVEPTNLAYPGLREVIECVSQPETHAVLLADLEFVREPSSVLREIATTMVASFPVVRVQCFIPKEAYDSLGMW